MKSSWKFFLDVTSEHKAMTVLKRVAERLQLENDWKVEPYHKGGFTTTMTIVHEGGRSEAIIDAIEITERVTRGIQLSGPITSSPSGFSDNCKVPGLWAVSWDFIE